MRTHSAAVPVRTGKVFDFVEITDEVQEVVDESGIRNGFVLLRSTHNTATVLCNENDPSVLADLENTLKRLLPGEAPWSHSYEGIENARAHQAVALLGHTHWVPIKGGKLVLGTWQALFLLELFEGRSRRIDIFAIGE